MGIRTDNNGKATLSHPWAYSIIRALEHSDIRYARHRPAQRPQASFECSKEFILAVNFGRCDEGNKHCSSRTVKACGRWLAAETSLARCSCSIVFSGCGGSMISIFFVLETTLTPEFNKTKQKCVDWRQIPTYRGQLFNPAFDPRPFLQTFEAAVDKLIAMRKEVQAKTEQMEKSVRVAEREYSKKMTELNRGFEVSSALTCTPFYLYICQAVSTSFSGMESRMNQVSTTAVRVGKECLIVKSVILKYLSRRTVGDAHRTPASSSSIWSNWSLWILC